MNPDFEPHVIRAVAIAARKGGNHDGVILGLVFGVVACGFVGLVVFLEVTKTHERNIKEAKSKIQILDTDSCFQNSALISKLQPQTNAVPRPLFV